MLTGVDVTLSGRALLGDLLALVGGVLAAAYVTVGGALRALAPAPREMSTTAYTTICYSTCAAAAARRSAWPAGQQLTGYAGGTWLKLAALTVGAQLLGHSLFNVVLRTTSPTVVSLAILFEVPGAVLHRRDLARPAAAGRDACPACSCCWSASRW